MTHALALTQSQHRQLQGHLIAADGRESAAILLCHHAKGASGVRLMVSELVLIPAEACTKRTATRVEWPVTEYLTPEKITEIDQRGLSIVTAHSHPEGHKRFSTIDDENDRKLFGSVCTWFDDGRPHGATIMVTDGSMVARLVDAKGKFTPMESVAAVGEDIRIWKAPKKQPKEPGAGLRIAQAFGKNTLGLLRGLRVGVVGCSGTGSLMVELLARNCVGQLVIVDPDLVEEKNLNRIVNASQNDARKGKPKVQVLKKAVEAMGTGTQVEALQAHTHDPQIAEALIGCDVLFGCVDSAAGRYHLECIASACWLPYFDVGVHLELDGAGKLTHALAAAHYMHPENPSLMSRGGYTSEQVTAENWRRTDPEYYEEQRRAGQEQPGAGYLQAVGEGQPAVISVNMQAACLAFNDFLARLHSFRLDDNDQFAEQRFQLVQGYYEGQPSEARDTDALFPKYAGMGDASPLLQSLKNRAG